MKANLFDVLNRMNVEHEGSVHAYFSNNIENLNAGSKGWGSVKMAITTGDAQELIAGVASGQMTKTVMLFVVDRAVMDRVRGEMETTSEDAP